MAHITTPGLKRFSAPAGVTLVELLVVIAVVALLLALLMPGLQSAREAARNTQCRNHLKQIGVAVHNYHASQRSLPPARQSGGNRYMHEPGPEPGTQNRMSWFVLILPQLEQQAVYDRWNLTLAYPSQTGTPDPRRIAIPTYFCPTRSRRTDALTEHPNPGAIGDYAASSGVDVVDAAGVIISDWRNPNANGAIICGECYDAAGNRMATENGGPCARWESRTTFDHIRDGLSNTLLAGEKHELDGVLGLSVYHGGRAQPAARRGDRALARGRADPAQNQFGSHHVGTCNFTFADGSVRPLNVELGVDILSALAPRAGRETPSLPD